MSAVAVHKSQNMFATPDSVLYIVLVWAESSDINLQTVFSVDFSFSM